MQATTTSPLSTVPVTASFGHGYENNLNYVLAEQHRERYLALYTILQQVSAAHIEGIQSVTLTTATGSVTVPLYGQNMDQRTGTLYTELSEVLGERLEYHEQLIACHEKDSLVEEPHEREGQGGRAEALSFCLPMRRLNDAEFAAMPPEARRLYDEHRAGLLQVA